VSIRPILSQIIKKRRPFKIIKPSVAAITILFCLFTQSLLAESFPENFSAHYLVNKGSINVGKTHRKLEFKDSRYIFESITTPRGIAKLFTSGKVVERSIWNYHNEQMRPMQYMYKNTGSKNKRDVTLNFDWKKNNVTNIINGDPWKMDLSPGILDKLLYQLAIMADLSDDKNQLLYKVADGGKIKTFAIKVEGTETIKTELGTFETLKVVRKEDKRTTTLWCAQVLNYLPVQIRQTKQDGSEVTAKLYAAEGFDWQPKTAD
jgi:hypothetical protein